MGASLCRPHTRPVAPMVLRELSRAQRSSGSGLHNKAWAFKARKITGDIYYGFVMRVQTSPLKVLKKHLVRNSCHFSFRDFPLDQPYSSSRWHR